MAAFRAILFLEIPMSLSALHCLLLKKSLINLLGLTSEDLFVMKSLLVCSLERHLVFTALSVCLSDLIFVLYAFGVDECLSFVSLL